MCKIYKLVTLLLVFIAFTYLVGFLGAVVFTTVQGFFTDVAVFIFICTYVYVLGIILFSSKNLEKGKTDENSD